MATMATLQSSFTSLSLSSSSFMGQRFSPPLCSSLISASFKISRDIFFQFLSFEAKGIAESFPKPCLQIGVPHLQIAHGSVEFNSSTCKECPSISNPSKSERDLLDSSEKDGMDEQRASSVEVGRVVQVFYFAGNNGCRHDLLSSRFRY
nr:50S ribosomal protein L24, chloroplastic [Ipomoea trifida]